MSVETPLRTSGWQLHATGPSDGSSALNYPDVSIANGTFPWIPGSKATMLPGSDGAGVIIAVGYGVQEFRISGKVIPLYYPTFHLGKAPSLEQMSFTPGSSPSVPGTFRKMGVFKQEHGIGGVSLFAALFALAAGAIVIATTSTEEKATRLRKLGVHHVLNYKEDPEWGAKAKELSPSGQGCHRVIEVRGQQTIAQSFQCVARGGEIDIIGFLTGQRKYDAGLTYLELLIRACTVRGIEVGNRVQFEEMVRAIERHDIRPVIDGKRFALAELQKA